MFNKTKVRSILELVGKDLSAREVSKVLSVSRNTVAEQISFLYHHNMEKFNIKPRIEITMQGWMLFT